MEKASAIWEIVEEGKVFDPRKSIHQGSTTGNIMFFDQHEDGDDGTFPRVSDWTSLANKVEKNGVSSYLTWIGASKMKFNAGYCTVIKEDNYSGNATLKFDKPITVVVGEVNGDPITTEVNEIEGEFNYDLTFRINGRQDKIANMIEVYFVCNKYLLK